MKRFFLLLASALLTIWGGLAWPASDFVPLEPATARALVDPAAYHRPTIVALWSIECSHCKKNLAFFAELMRTQRHVQLITIAAEPCGTHLAAPLDRLQLPGMRHCFGSAAHEAIAYAIDPRWHGELPRTLLFDGQGGKVGVSGIVDRATLERAFGPAFER